MASLALVQNPGVLRPLQPPFLSPASASTATTAAASYVLTTICFPAQRLQTQIPHLALSHQPQGGWKLPQARAVQALLELPHLPQGPAALPQVSQAGEAHLLIITVPCLVLLSSNLREAEGPSGWHQSCRWQVKQEGPAPTLHHRPDVLNPECSGLPPLSLLKRRSLGLAS